MFNILELSLADRRELGELCDLQARRLTRAERLTLSNHFSPRWRRTRNDVYADNFRVRPAAFRRGKADLAAILRKKGSAGRPAAKARRQLLDAAADQQLVRAARKQRRQNRVAAIDSRKDLIRDLDRLTVFITKLSPHQRAKLNRIVPADSLLSFDSEVFVFVIEMLATTLDGIRPKRKAAARAVNVIYKRIRMPGTARSARSELIDRWETMPTQIRLDVEAAMRISNLQKLLPFMRRLAKELRKRAPTNERRPAAMRAYARRAATIWNQVGLNVGRTYAASDSRELESPFQRAGRAALQAMGDGAGITPHMVRQINRELRVTPSNILS